MLYFAYGSNLSFRQMEERCPGAKRLCAHRLEGFRLALRGVADIEEAVGECIEGAIYEITDEHAVTLDGFEGVPNVYARRWFDCEHGRVMYYQMVSPNYRKPREGYVATIEAGYSDWGLSTKPLLKAVQTETERYRDERSPV